MGKRRLYENEKEDILDFIIPRAGVPIDSELSIVNLKKQGLKRQLDTIMIHEELIPKLKAKLHKIYIEAQITPGDCVGIIGAQSMGEFSTQSTLNTFHSTGIDTGSVSATNKFQNLINASKIIKNERLALKISSIPKSIQDLRVKMTTMLVGIKVSDLVLDTDYHLGDSDPLPDDPSTLLFNVPPEASKMMTIFLSKRKIYHERIHPMTIIRAIEKTFPNVICTFGQFGASSSASIVMDLFSRTGVAIPDNTGDVHLSGIEGIHSIDIVKDMNDEWMIETIGGRIMDILQLEYERGPLGIDMNTIVSSSIWDIHQIYGIEATRQFLINEFNNILTGVDECHKMLLADRMTFNGIVEPITRYTMRTTDSPLARASFEESFESFIRAAKYNEVEHFRGVSSSVIGGKKSRVGTFLSDIFINLPILMDQTAISDLIDEICEEDYKD